MVDPEELHSLETSRNNKRRSLFEARDKIDEQREKLINDIENKLKQTLAHKNLFQIDWRLI